MDKVIVPLELDKSLDKGDGVHVQTEKFSLNREHLIDSLKHIGGIAEVVKSLKPDEVYKFVLTPENATLYKDAAGNLKGVFYKDGKIVEHAKLKAVKPDIAKVATAIGTQILLLDIAVQLRQIEKTLTTIRKEINNDRIAEIESGIRQFEMAIHSNNLLDRQMRINNSIQNLVTGLEKVKKALKVQIAELPEAKNGLFDNWGKKKSLIAQEKFAIAEESLEAYIKGTKFLSEIFAINNEPINAQNMLLKCITDLKECNIESAILKTRLLPYENGEIDSETKWKNIEKILRETPEKLKTINMEYKTIEIELKPRELLEINHDSKM